MVSFLVFTNLPPETWEALIVGWQVAWHLQHSRSVRDSAADRRGRADSLLWPTPAHKDVSRAADPGALRETRLTSLHDGFPHLADESRTICCYIPLKYCFILWIGLWWKVNSQSDVVYTGTDCSMVCASECHERVGLYLHVITGPTLSLRWAQAGSVLHPNSCLFICK